MLVMSRMGPTRGKRILGKGKWLMLCVTVRTLMLAWLLLTGCATSESKEFEGGAKSKSVVVGFIQVEPKGPYFRMHQKDAFVRFFDVRNTSTGEWTRVHLTEKAERFVTRLFPGHYEIFRVQIGEGPFRSESQVDMNFNVFEDKTMYLGTWRFRVEAPKTVRMLHWDVLGDVPDWDQMVPLHPELGDKALVVSLPQPVTNQNRLFSVAPSQPRAKYFYRR
jgi:hypothetical protein